MININMFVQDVILKYGSDLSDVDLTGVMILPEDDLRDIILPKDIELFQKIFNKSIGNAFIKEIEFKNIKEYI